MSQKTGSDTAIGLVLSDDLMFSSRITGTARDLGFAMTIARTSADLVQLAGKQAPQCVILDLSNPGLDIAGLVQQLRGTDEAKPFLVAYGSHVDNATLQAGRAAGCHVVLPRSKFVEALPRDLAAWFGR